MHDACVRWTGALVLALLPPPAAPWRAAAPSTMTCGARPHGRRCAAARLEAAAAPAERGHCFVVQGDLRLVTADAVLYPTRSIRSQKWFPHGPPAGARPVAAADFTPEQRVHRAPGGPAAEPDVWLGWLYWEDAEEPPPLSWFISAADQFLRGAYATSRASAPLCGRELPIFALPVVGTGRAGGRAGTGQLLSALLLLLTRFCATHAADVVLVTKGDRMFSAAQSSRQRLESALPALRLDASAGPAALGSSWRALGPRLRAEADRLAALGRAGQLVLFLGSGTSQTNDMPGWSDLLSELALAHLAGFGHADLVQLRSLALKDQAFVLQHRLGKQALARRAREAAVEAVGAAEASAGVDRGGGGPAARRGARAAAASVAAASSAASIDEVQGVGRTELQRLAVARLTTTRYSVTHALLATLPHSATVTTNSDTCYDAACAAAGIPVTVLPYESRGRETEERWLLKLHGDVAHPEDIVLTYSGSAPYGYEREALSGIVQALLITKHMCFVGFSLTDEAFNGVAATVRKALQPTDAGRAARRGKVKAGFGSALTLSDRPFMAELWPELCAVPMGDGVAEDGRARARRWRTLEIMLDRISLQTSDTSTHLLDPKFEGAFTVADLELQSEIGALLDGLRRDGALAQRGEAFAAVRDMLTQLGLPSALVEGVPGAEEDAAGA